MSSMASTAAGLVLLEESLSEKLANPDEDDDDDDDSSISMSMDSSIDNNISVAASVDTSLSSSDDSDDDDDDSISTKRHKNAALKQLARAALLGDSCKEKMNILTG